MRQFLRILIALGILAFATSMLAVSCGKTGGGGNNNSGNNNSGGGNGNGGSGGCTGICPTTNLVLTAAEAYVKVSGNTVTINAAGLAGGSSPLSDADDNDRGFQDAPGGTGGAKLYIFIIKYPDTSRAALFFVSRAHVTKDTITMKAAVTGTTGTIPDCTSSESGDDALARAAGGAHCRSHDTNGNDLYFSSYLGTVFDNTKTSTHARGLMQCGSILRKEDTRTGSYYPIIDTLTFDASQTSCFLAVVNSASGAATAEIDDAWVADSGSTSEVELNAIGIDVDGKTIPQFSSETGLTLLSLKKPTTTLHSSACCKTTTGAS